MILMVKWYPIHLDMSGRHCVIVGGGHIALRRIVGLLEVGAKVTVISPHCHSDILRLATESNVTISSRMYEGIADLRSADLVYAATDDEIVNKQISDDAKKLQIPMNHLGNSKLSTFLIPAVLRRGRLVMSVSTSGASPGLSKRIRRELSACYGTEYEVYVDFLAELREWVQTDVADEQCRAMIFHQVLKLDIIDLIKLEKLHDLRSWLKTMLQLELQVSEWEKWFMDYSNNL